MNWDKNSYIYGLIGNPIITPPTYKWNCRGERLEAKKVLWAQQHHPMIFTKNLRKLKLKCWLTKWENDEALIEIRKKAVRIKVKFHEHNATPKVDVMYGSLKMTQDWNQEEFNMAPVLEDILTLFHSSTSDFKKEASNGQKY